MMDQDGRFGVNAVTKYERILVISRDSGVTTLNHAQTFLRTEEDDQVQFQTPVVTQSLRAYSVTKREILLT